MQFRYGLGILFLLMSTINNSLKFRKELSKFRLQNAKNNERSFLKYQLLLMKSLKISVREKQNSQ